MDVYMRLYVRISGAAENFAHLPRTLSAPEVLSRTQFRKIAARVEAEGRGFKRRILGYSSNQMA